MSWHDCFLAFATLLAACGALPQESRRGSTSANAVEDTSLARSRVEALLNIFGDQQDDFTPAVYELTVIGIPALQFGTLELLLSEDALTRRRAQRVMEGVAARQMGFKPGQGWPDAETGEQFQMLLRAMNYRWDAHPKDRDEAYRRWKKWVSKNATDPASDWGYRSAESKR